MTGPQKETMDDLIKYCNAFVREGGKTSDLLTALFVLAVAGAQKEGVSKQDVEKFAGMLYDATVEVCGARDVCTCKPGAKA